MADTALGDTALDLWKHFAKSFVGATATVILAGVVALATGFIKDFRSIKDTVERQALETKILNIKLEARDQQYQAIQEHIKDKDSELRGRLDAIQNDHAWLIQNIRQGATPQKIQPGPRSSEGKTR